MEGGPHPSNTPFHNAGRDQVNAPGGIANKTDGSGNHPSRGYVQWACILSAPVGSHSSVTNESQEFPIRPPRPTRVLGVIRKKQFHKWRDRADLPAYNGVLWIKGKPGAGKSTLMKHALLHCEKVFDDQLIILEKTPLGVLRSIIYQLLDNDYTLYERFRPIYKKQRMHDKEGDIDAVQAGITLRICLSSRHYPNVSMRKTLELAVEGSEDHRRDIATYITHKLERHDDNIKDKIRKKAGGIAIYVVNISTLEEVPADLEEVFNRFLSEDDRNKTETIRMLQWVLLSRRPLKPEELFFAVLTGTASEYTRPWNRSKITGHGPHHPTAHYRIVQGP
ncbi:hypothetical protein N657DRAFT_636541 [Parathielavia appendiculata]|uniref:Nephrocystin 3-like N-terminal domain-containing protein n=1 Tax=Parathielavia appendiculata TaxID=2587402 RepID=A0AAN6TU80_9PEZI|nr:hypothetical protein N657DRAFT_636541 [Parathielavia appendiculata]